MKQRQSRGLMPWILTLLCAVLLTVWVLGSMPAAPKEGAAVAAGTAYLDSAAAKDASAIAETLREREKQRRAELRAKIKACEDEMEACGAREVELDNEINSPEVYNDPDLLRQKSDELSDLRFHQEELFAAWEKAMEEQEQYEQAAGEE